jgi:hypothetical protein
LIDTGIEHQGRRGEAVFKRGQIDKGLDRRAGLPLRLDRPVELADREAEAAGKRQHAPGMRIERDEGAGDQRHLA